MENLFSILDENGDEKVTEEEINDFASISDDEFQDKNYSILNGDDFAKVYENAMAAKDCEITYNDRDEIYTYKDGTITDGRAYSVKRVTAYTVYVINPWDSSKEIAYPKDKFLDNSLVVATADLSECS